MVSMEQEKRPRSTVAKAIVIIAIILLALLFFSWVLTRGVANDIQTENPDGSTTSTTNSTVPGGQNNPASTGGSTGTGTGTSNDTTIQTPSPAGGVDTNGSSTNQ